ncbi:unnamed protein product [Bursaphelenchus okinawaensis]|uniref:ZP domain-containing protein n=1 Tax=Bursaphelenchus okinawaensis TaxID=465554 RepID=A0A811L829_9BILA|nr:unnamed protein product [Bursaphelenchus okinawaensis]CAG9117924.1 unnamed protein product [Bursaphelenchus okinawaensis]
MPSSIPTTILLYLLLLSHSHQTHAGGYDSGYAASHGIQGPNGEANGLNGGANGLNGGGGGGAGGGIFGGPKANGGQIPNALVNEPVVTCGAESVSIDFTTSREFSGRIFVKGYSQDTSCSLNGSGAKIHGFSINFDQCGLRRNREMNGVSIAATVVVSFHPIFITKADRAYKVNCFYMEARKTVNQNLEVSAITTKAIDRQASLPVCKYEILTDGPNGGQVHYAKIGDQVYHKWSCHTDVADVYCMKVHSCTVNDGQGGDPVTVLDENGCEIDGYVLQNLDYQSDLVAGQSAYVFKFADKPTLHFNCQIELALKDKNAGCAYTKPQCQSPADYSTGYGSKPSNGGGYAASGSSSASSEAFPRPPTPNSPNFGNYQATTVPLPPKAGMFQTEVNPSSYSGESASEEFSYSGLGNGPPGVSPPTGYKGMGASQGFTPGLGKGKNGYKKVVKRDDTNKVADFDLPEQQLVVIEIDEDEKKSENRSASISRSNQQLCLSSTIFAGLFAASALLCGMIAVFLYSALRNHRSAIQKGAWGM